MGVPRDGLRYSDSALRGRSSWHHKTQAMAKPVWDTACADDTTALNRRLVFIQIDHTALLLYSPLAFPIQRAGQKETLLQGHAVDTQQVDLDCNMGV